MEYKVSDGSDEYVCVCVFVFPASFMLDAKLQNRL